MPGGSTWHVGVASEDPPYRRTIAFLSMARFSARRTRTSSNGGRVVLNWKKSVVGMT
jgi:hypothetical protein